MLSNSSPEFSQKSLKIKQDDKFFTRLLSKETNPSFRVYYGNVSGAVPFTWEIQPGTPKHNFSDNSVPPLTPPPSYYTPNHHDHDHKPSKRKYYQRSKLLYNLLLNINLIKKGHVASSSPSSLSSSSWSSSLSNGTPVSSKGYRSRRRRFASFGSSFDDGHVYGGGSPDSVMCFGRNNENKSSRVSCDNSNGGGGGGSYTVVIMKKAFLSIVGRRSNTTF
ncbi:hypothetical protein OSB04_022719 [Centaurea solstitialis]|uniref:Uncharacterized protein n=1 Tax=Centaurea solstitialis TaxID=347529 RepID=A0AA38T1B8_9ASTR|nr:hypothetical protein OSB04_022719 [Centaurea solstitialis]